MSSPSISSMSLDRQARAVILLLRYEAEERAKQDSEDRKSGLVDIENETLDHIKSGLHDIAVHAAKTATFSHDTTFMEALDALISMTDCTEVTYYDESMEIHSAEYAERKREGKI